MRSHEFRVRSRAFALRSGSVPSVASEGIRPGGGAARTPCLRRMYAVCAPYVRRAYAVCTPCVRRMYAVCAPYVRRAYAGRITPTLHQQVTLYGECSPRSGPIGEYPPRRCPLAERPSRSGSLLNIPHGVRHAERPTWCGQCAGSSH